MPRPSRPSLYLRGGVWHYRFTALGRRQRGSTGERDRAAAQAALASAWAEAHRGHGAPPGGPAAQLDLESLARLWLAELKERAAERGPTYVRRHREAIELALPHFALAGDVTDERWQEAMRTLHAQGSGWRTLQIVTYSLRLLCRYAVRAGALRAAPEIRPPPARLIAREQAPRRALTEQERDRVLRALRAGGDHRAARIWQVMSYTGLRRGELARLTLRWLDLRAGVLHVPAGAAKSGKAESVPLHQLARQAIRAEALERKVDRDSPVFGPSDIRRAWGRALARARIDAHGLTVYHSARHTYGELVAAAARGDVSAVMAAGRWRSLSVVQRYVHASAERARAAVKRL